MARENGLDRNLGIIMASGAYSYDFKRDTEGRLVSATVFFPPVLPPVGRQELSLPYRANDLWCVSSFW